MVSLEGTSACGKSTLMDSLGEEGYPIQTFDYFFDLLRDEYWNKKQQTHGIDIGYTLMKVLTINTTRIQDRSIFGNLIYSYVFSLMNAVGSQRVEIHLNLSFLLNKIKNEIPREATRNIIVLIGQPEKIANRLQDRNGMEVNWFKTREDLIKYATVQNECFTLFAKVFKLDILNVDDIQLENLYDAFKKTASFKKLIKSNLLRGTSKSAGIDVITKGGYFLSPSGNRVHTEDFIKGDMKNKILLVCPRSSSFSKDIFRIYMYTQPGNMENRETDNAGYQVVIIDREHERIIKRLILHFKDRLHRKTLAEDLTMSNVRAKFIPRSNPRAIKTNGLYRENINDEFFLEDVEGDYFTIIVSQDKCFGILDMDYTGKVTGNTIKYKSDSGFFLVRIPYLLPHYGENQIKRYIRGTGGFGSTDEEVKEEISTNQFSFNKYLK